MKHKSFRYSYIFWARHTRNVFYSPKLSTTDCALMAVYRHNLPEIKLINVFLRAPSMRCYNSPLIYFILFNCSKLIFRFISVRKYRVLLLEFFTRNYLVCLEKRPEEQAEVCALVFTRSHSSPSSLRLFGIRSLLRSNLMYVYDCMC